MKFSFRPKSAPDHGLKKKSQPKDRRSIYAPKFSDFSDGWMVPKSLQVAAMAGGRERFFFLAAPGRTPVFFHYSAIWKLCVDFGRLRVMWKWCGIKFRTRLCNFYVRAQLHHRAGWREGHRKITKNRFWRRREKKKPVKSIELFTFWFPTRIYHMKTMRNCSAIMLVFFL